MIPKQPWTPNRALPAVFLVLGMITLPVFHSTAGVISVNFTGLNAPPVEGPAGLTAISNWNNLAGAGLAIPTALIDDTGSDSGASITFASSQSGLTMNLGQFSENLRLFDGQIFASNEEADAVVELRNIPYTKYDMIVYYGHGPNHQNRTVTISDGTTTFFAKNENLKSYEVPVEFVQVTTSNTPASKGNHVVFRELSTLNTTLTLSYLDGRSGIAGIQVVAALVDADGDGLDDIWEVENFPSISSHDADDDPDGDGLDNLKEAARRTNPLNPDTDHDGLTDEVETNSGVFSGTADTGTDPLNSNSDGDRVKDGGEVNRGYNPLNAMDEPYLPNVILIIADDLGSAEVGVYGQTLIQTPRLDQMAAEGMRFTQFYSSASICAPARCQMLTGKHAGHAVIRDNTNLNASGYQTALPAGTFTFGHLMQRAGYATSCIGKWALGGPGSTGMPNQQGFDHFFGYLGQIQAHHYYPSRLWRNEEQAYYSPTLASQNSTTVDIPGANNDRGFKILNSSLGNKENDGNVHAHDAMTAEALQWIKDHQNEAFFLYLPYTVPHLGLQVPAHIDDLTDTDGIVFDNTIRTAIDEFYPDRPFGSPIPHPGSSHYAPTGDMRHDYAAMISAMDRDVGRILDLVTTLELDEDTMILFTSDNGPSFANEVDTAFFQSTGFLRGRKNILLEGGIRVPMIARWPGQIPPGTVADEPAMITDFLPTLAELVGETLPEHPDGVSLLPTLIDASACQDPHPPLYWEEHRTLLKQAVRSGPWKVRRNGDIHAGQNLELFNIEADPFELLEQSAAQPDILDQLVHIMATEHTMSASEVDFLGNNEFLHLANVSVTYDPSGFKLVSGSASGGHVMNPLKTAVTSDVRIVTAIRMEEGNNRYTNGFFLCGSGTNITDALKIGVDGGRKAFLLSHGADMVEIPFEEGKDPLRLFDLEIEYSPGSGLVRVTEETQTFQTVLSSPLTNLTHTGYAVENAIATFHVADVFVTDPPQDPPPTIGCDMVELILNRRLPPPGPGFGNMEHATGMLFQVISRFSESNGVPPQISGKKRFGTNTGSMHNGYFVTTFAPDSGSGPGGFLFYDVFDPYNPVLINRVYEPDGRTKDFRESHSFGFCHDRNRKMIALQTGKGIEFWDLSDVLNPIQLSKLALPQVNFGDYVRVAWQLYWQAPYVYVAASNQGIYIIDASDPTTPRLVDRGPGETNPISPAFLGGFRVGPIFAFGNQMLISSMGRSFSGFSVLDISNPIHPRLLSTVPIVPHQYYSTCFNGTHITFSARMASARMFLFDVQDPLLPALENLGPAIPRQLYCTYQDNFIFQGCQEEVVKLDITDPGNAQIVGRGSFGLADPDHGQVTAIGNVLYAGNDHGTGSGFFVHQLEPDLQPPHVHAVNPFPGATGEALCSRIGISFSDNIMVSSVDSQSFIVRPAGGNPLPGLYSVWLGIVNFAPDDPLEPNTRYEVALPAGGISDWTGNAIDEAFTSTFTTGTTCPGPPIAPPDGLVGQWLLDDNADDSTGTNHGTVTDAVFEAGALVFDGTNDVITMSKPLHTHLGGSASLLFWLRTTQSGNANFRAAPGIAGVASAVGKDDILWGWLDETGRIGIQARDGPPAKSLRPVNDGSWHYIGLTRDAVNGQVAVYVDGAPQQQVVGQIGNNAIPFDAFGRIEDRFGTADHFAGSLDDIRIYNRTLSSSEVMGIFGGLEVTVASHPPREAGQAVELTAESIGTGTFRYSFNFGDGSPPTLWSSEPEASHVYGAPGHYSVVASISNATQSTSSSFLQTVHRPLTTRMPATSSTIVHDGDRVYCVNEDNNTLSALDTTTLSKLWEQPAGRKPRTLSVGPDGAIWVANEGSSSITRHDHIDGSLLETIPLQHGSAPYGVVVSPDGTNVFITLAGSGELMKRGTNTLATFTYLGPTPRGLAVSADGSRVLVTRLVSNDLQGEVWEIDATTMAVTKTISLLLDQTTTDSTDAARGLPNYLRSVVISPDGTEAWVTAKKDNILRGALRDAQALTFETTVRSLSSKIDMTRSMEAVDDRIDHDDRGQPAAAAYTPFGDYAFVALEGSNEIEIRDVYSRTAVGGIVLDGLAPRGLAVNDDGSRLFAHNFMSRSVEVYDISAVTAASGFAPPKVADISMVADERLPPDVLLGKQIFYNGADDRMSRDDYLSCASCHLDGNDDGRTWDFTDRGEGLRNTISLNSRGGTAQGPLHWSGNFDEIQDFEHNIRGPLGGVGFLPDPVFQSGTRNEPLGDPKAGLSPDLDALATYIDSLTSAPASPHRNADGTFTPDAVAGREIFTHLDCQKCHSPPRFTDSEIGLLHDVGTLTSRSGNRSGLPLEGIDTPGLAGVWATPPYFHDGSAATLADILVGSDTNHVQSGLSDLTQRQVQQLIAFLEQLEGPRDLRPFDLWRHEYMSLAESLDPQTRGDQADPDQDGAENIMEYALAKNPMLPDWSPPLRMDLANGILSLRRSAKASGVTLHLEKSVGLMDPLTWHDAEYPVLFSMPGGKTHTDIHGLTQQDLLRDTLHFRLRLEWQ